MEAIFYTSMYAHYFPGALSEKKVGSVFPVQPQSSLRKFNRGQGMED
jgi:hypothetical protein